MLDNDSEIRYNKTHKTIINRRGGFVKIILKKQEKIKRMCDICRKMRCPRLCPSYDGRRRGEYSPIWREGGSFRACYENHLENRMIDEMRMKGKNGTDEAKNKV